VFILQKNKYSIGEKLNRSQYEQYLKMREDINIIPTEYIREHGKDISAENKHENLLNEIQEPLNKKRAKVKPTIILSVIVIVLFGLVPGVFLSISEKNIENMSWFVYLLLIFAFGAFLDYTLYMKLKNSILTMLALIEKNPYEIYEFEITRKIQTVLPEGRAFLIETGNLTHIVSYEQYRKCNDKTRVCLLINSENEIADYFLV
jgi:uncharacterized protein with PQ loop repeat